MSSTSCRGLQSCLEPKLCEPLVLGLKLAPHIPHPSQPLQLVKSSSCTSDFSSDIGPKHEEKYNSSSNNDDDDKINDITSDDINEDNKNNPNGEFGGWSFIEALSKEAKGEKESLYVHPLVKRSSSTLSIKSLELCTENLGCETGSDIGENNDISSSSSSDSECGNSMKSRQNSELRKVTCPSFPPPLTSIQGSNNIHFKPLREGGRLVIKAVAIAPLQTYFQADRSDGRLRLRFMKKNYDSSCFEEEENIVDEEEEEEKESDDELGDEINGNNVIVGAEIGIRDFQRPGRCDEEGGRRNKEMLIWEPCWVATS